MLRVWASRICLSLDDPNVIVVEDRLLLRDQQGQQADAASASLAVSYRFHLEKMGVPMGEGSYDVLDVHSRKGLLALYTGELCGYTCCNFVRDEPSCDLCW